MNGLKALGIIAAAVALLVLVWGFDDYPARDHIGKAEYWSRDFPFSRYPQAVVLQTGLDDPRGIASDRAGDVFIAEANGRVFEFSAAEKYSEAPPSQDMPAYIDQRGIAFNEDLILTAVHDAGKITKRHGPVGAPPEQPLLDGALTGPSGLAVSGQTLFITDDRPWPGAGPDPAFDSADYTRWLDKDAQRMFGSVWACSPVIPCVPAPLNVRLLHPTGIAAASDGLLYVVESGSHEVRWAILKQDNGAWSEIGALGSVQTPGDPLPSFLGIALDRNQRYVFAAGPKSLYVFSRQDRNLLGRIVFEGPVSGVAYCAGQIYLIVGRQLCRIEMN
jgi:hypothetical protein